MYRRRLVVASWSTVQWRMTTQWLWERPTGHSVCAPTTTMSSQSVLCCSSFASGCCKVLTLTVSVWEQWPFLEMKKTWGQWVIFPWLRWVLLILFSTLTLLVWLQEGHHGSLIPRYSLLERWWKRTDGDWLNQVSFFQKTLTIQSVVGTRNDTFDRTCRSACRVCGSICCTCVFGSALRVHAVLVNQQHQA